MAEDITEAAVYVKTVNAITAQWDKFAQNSAAVLFHMARAKVNHDFLISTPLQPRVREKLHVKKL